MTKNGIDVSKFQGKIDFEKVKKSGVDFVIIRAGYGNSSTQKDSCFENNYQNAKKSGLSIGAYWYSYAVSAQEAEKEAQACLEVIKDKTFEYPIYFDIEEPSQLALGKAKCSEIAAAFLEQLEKSGYWVGIYSSKSHLENFISEDLRNRYAVWVAHYTTGKTDYSGGYGMWQYSEKGSVSGISGNCDMDYCYVDYPALIKAQGRNGYTKSLPTLDSSGFKKGDKTIGSLALKELLLIAKRCGLVSNGIDENQHVGDGTVRAINGLLKKWGYAQTGVAGEGFIKRLAKEIEQKIK